MFGVAPKWDFFISYRVAANADEARELFDQLTADGQATVFFDKECLPDGENWEKEFCKGLVDSRVFVPIVSEDAIKHPSKTWQNFEMLTEDQLKCDNVFLEHCLALELRQRGYIEKIFPIMIGKKQGNDYVKIDHRLEMPQNCPDKIIRAVQLKVNQHLESNSLGCPHKQRTVAATWAEIAACQGAEVEGAASIALQDPVKRLMNLKNAVSQSCPPHSVSSSASLSSGPDSAAHLKNELEAERARIAQLEDEVKDLHMQLQLLQQRQVSWQEQIQSSGTTTHADENDPDMLPKRPKTPQPRSSTCAIQ
jgi:hypothetical protein